MRNDTHWILAGAAAAILLPGLALIGVPFLFAAIIAAVAFVGLVVLLSPRKAFEDIGKPGIGKQQTALARELLTQAEPFAEQLLAASRRISDPIVRNKSVNLVEITREIFDEVEANPEKASAVQRFLSYYLPQAAQIAEGYVNIEAKHAPRPERLAAIAEMIDKLEGAFIHYSDGLAEADLGTLDVDLRAIETSLEEDIRR